MKESKIDFFESIFDLDVDAICVPTNGHYNRLGSAVMKGKCAQEAARRWPEIQIRLGKLLRSLGNNIPYVIGALNGKAENIELTSSLIIEHQFKCLIFNFPTTHNLTRGPEIGLIKQSAKIIMDYINQYNLKKVILARPGVGISELKWDAVRLEIENILDDRVTVVSFENEE
jgi:hypothetical protein